MIGIGILGLAIVLLCGQLAGMYMELMYTQEILEAVQEPERKKKIRRHTAAPDWDRILAETELERGGREKT